MLEYDCMPLKPGLKPEEVATRFYQAIMDNDYPAFLECFTKWHQEREKGRPKLYWGVGRKLVDEKGYTYRIHKPGFLERARLMARAADMIAEGRDPRRPQPKGQKKIFFQRYLRTGEKTGYPMPIILVKDPDTNGEWRVELATI
jgi:hypothetical protein